KKSKKKGWKNHDPKNCSCEKKHDCLRNWHIHMLCTDFLPAKYQHPRCGLGKYDDQVDIKRVSHLKVNGRPIKSAEQVVIYLAKYLAKAFKMRQDPELAKKVGLLKGMSIYKFFRVIYGYDEAGRAYIADKVKKPLTSSKVFINNEYGFQQEVEQEFSPYFDEKGHLKKDARKILQKKEPQPTNNGKITDLLKLCLRYSTKSKIKQNQF
ncbi:3393_t:CDS:2, partial [Racocetra persica]